MLKNILLRSAAVLAAGLGLTLALGGAAHAAGPEPVPAGELSKATSAASSPTAFSLLGQATAASKSAKSIAKPTVAREARPVYALNPAFVRDAAAPVATFWYAATPATRGTDKLTVYTAPDATGAWQAVNVATGDTESRMFAKANGALVFTEPQIGAWYALTADRIRPLNPSAVDSIGSTPITVAAYQDLVATRYADKQAGSSYADNGTAGGYNPTATTDPEPTTNLWIPLTTSALGILVLAFVIHRRRTA
ncbi:hypothetical protein HPO96_36215 [Kribbella sandramycini]|uniref:MYXO-CTERM domain-containing protein n=1 Tax=Kribbella sandramycini TaxID=60450 RepID=A0A7Y4L7E6_9ACTN|nr:hypothetical protein [Kribbella sandramycini]MBB6570172.1 hypothetical protein [Kribbella sandramycini]NOL45703.1 hypothetical protein [Kribbella sandramycini]